MKRAYKKPSKSRKWRRERARVRNNAAKKCPRCGEFARHYVRPTLWLGDDGFYLCEAQNSETLPTESAV